MRPEIRVVLGLKKSPKKKKKTTENRGIHKVVAVVAVERTAKKAGVRLAFIAENVAHGVILGGKAHPLLSPLLSCLAR